MFFNENISMYAMMFTIMIFFIGSVIIKSING